MRHPGVPRRPGLLALGPLLAGAQLQNAILTVDLVQNNPGDSVGWQQTKYADAAVLAAGGWNGQAATGEMSGTQAVDFHTLGHDFFPAGSTRRQWLDAYAAGLHAFVDRAAEANIDPYFYVDLLVFPLAVLEAWPNATVGHGSSRKVVWNDATKALLRVLVSETFAEFPKVRGWIVRTGETYTYDTPYHAGNSPSNGTAELWVDFITTLRHEVCVVHGRRLLMRQWDNWPSDARYYVSMSDRVPPHELLYFSIKHSSADFTRPAEWNPALGVGSHAQVVEVELQREYEGKGAYPNYIMDGVIDGFPEMAFERASGKVGLSALLGKPQLRGLWTWTRGGGWWGPYLHGNEVWVDLHAQVLLRWWVSNVGGGHRGGQKPIKDSTGGGKLSEPEAFGQACEHVLAGCTVASGCCAALRNISQAGALTVLFGQWGVYASPGAWMRDDRIGGLNQTREHWRAVAGNATLWHNSLADRASAAANFERLQRTWQSDVAPHLSDPVQRDRTAATVEYGARLYRIVEAAWRAMAQGYLHANPQGRWAESRGETAPQPHFDPAALQAAIADYDAAIAGYRAFGLSNVFAPSLYHPYYLCLGTKCNCAFDPSPLQDGIGATIDALRDLSSSSQYSNVVAAERKHQEELLV